MIDTLFSNPLVFIISVISIVIAIAVHEFAHAKVADSLGDPTPGIQGRLTLNPMAHLDLYGTLLLLVFGFGWGKPVQFDPFNLKNPRKDAALISIAGPISNFIIAIISSLLLRLFILLQLDSAVVIGQIFLVPLIIMNLVLALFNLIPVHPLDGFKIVGGLLSERQAREWNQLQRYGIVFLVILIFPFGERSMIRTILDPALSFFYMLFIP